MQPTSRDPRLAASVVLAVIVFAGFFRPDEARPQRYVYTAGDSLHPRVQYADSSISVNDRCAVRMTKLSRSMRPVYVNGQPIGFC